MDPDGEDRHIPTLMSGIEIDPNAGDYQKWYQRFIITPGSVISQIQAEINQLRLEYPTAEYAICRQIETQIGS